MTKNNRQLQLIKLNKSLIKLLAHSPHEKKSLFAPVHHHHAAASKPKRKNSFKNTWLITIFLAVITSSVVFGLGIAVFSRFALLEAFLTMMSASPFMGESNILVIGMDSVGGSHRSDTMMVVHVSPVNKTVSVISIPRDTIVNVPGIGLTKINHSYAYGGKNLTRRTLENLFGIKIPFAVTINMSGLEKIIDTLGGLNIDIEKRMYYVDYAGGLYVDLYPGYQHLNGRQALGYVRFRNDGQGDFGRIVRQQKFVQAIGERIITKKNVLSAPKVIMSLLSNVETNMSVRQVLGLSLAMRQSFDIGNIATISLSGEPVMIDKVFYLRPDPEQIRSLSAEYLRPHIRKREAVAKWRKSHT